jgi:hypothetical protein
MLKATGWRRPILNVKKGFNACVNSLGLDPSSC